MGLRRRQSNGTNLPSRPHSVRGETRRGLEDLVIPSAHRPLDAGKRLCASKRCRSYLSSVTYRVPIRKTRWGRIYGHPKWKRRQLYRGVLPRRREFFVHGLQARFPRLYRRVRVRPLPNEAHSVDSTAPRRLLRLPPSVRLQWLLCLTISV